jgi:hypothetical protein
MSRQTVVPAQILTVEDKIAGSLSMRQLILIGTGVIGSGGIYLVMEPSNKASLLKALLLLAFNAATLGSAVRYKGSLLMDWAFVGLVYTFRPRHWIYDKQSTYLRDTEQQKSQEDNVAVEVEKTNIAPLPTVDLSTKIEIERLLRDPAKQVRYVNTKGGLKIVFTAEAE